MKLYTHPLSPACRKVLVTAAILDIPLELVVVNAQASEHRTPEYMKLNPNALFPTLCDGDFILWESNAIVQYIASKKAGNSLWPDDARLRVDITRWQSWELAHWGPAARPYIWEEFFQGPDRLRRARPRRTAAGRTAVPAFSTASRRPPRWSRLAGRPSPHSRRHNGGLAANVPIAG